MSETDATVGREPESQVLRDHLAHPSGHLAARFAARVEGSGQASPAILFAASTVTDEVAARSPSRRRPRQVSVTVK